jgi:predicted nucleic acid binding AN1-type Zn finger protein
MPKELCATEGCGKKLALTSIKCKCEKRFCDVHRYPEDHLCSFDFRADGKAGLLRHMSTAVLAKKVDVI